MARAKGKRNRRKEKLEFVQDYLPIRDLKNGIIETTDDRYIKILEIEPINFTLRSDEEQFNIISSFASWLKISPMRLQFKSITRRADSDKHISMICEELEHEENPQCKELGEDYIGLIKDVGNREALTRRFFLIFQYEAVGRNESDDYAKIYGMLQTAEQTARAYFMQCGNSIIQSKDPDEATAEILYMFYNRRSCTDEPFSSRVDRIVVDTMAAKKKIIGMDPVPPIRMANFLASRGIDLSHYNYVVMDGLYYSFLYIKAGGYPSRVRAGWMSSLINAGEGVDIDVHLRRENRSRTIDKVAQRIRLNRTKLKSMQDTSTDYEELTNSIQAGYFIKNGIANYKLLPVGMFIALDYVWDQIKSDRTKRKAIFIDEIWQLIGASSNRMAAEFCLEIFKVIRGFGGAAISATQDLSDFFGLEDGKYGRAIINNSKNKIILNLEPDEARYVQETLKLTRTEIRAITRFERGEALISSNNNKVPVVVKASKLEKEMITTDRAELEAILKERQREKTHSA